MSALLQTGAALALLAAVFVPLERLFAARRQPLLRREWGTDLLFFLGQYLLWTGLVVSGLVALAGAVDALPLAGLRAAVATQPGWLQAVEVVLLGDLLVYWGHRASHRFELLWRFHRVHHTAERLDWLAAHREHPLDGLYTQVLVNLPAIVLGFPLATIAGVAAFRGMWGVFIHSNVRLPLGPLKVLLGAPELHHWHHDRETGHRCNFANLMPLMDLIFGTYRDPGREPDAYGVPEPVPRSYAGQLAFPLAPWLWRGRMASPRAQEAPAMKARTILPLLLATMGALLLPAPPAAAAETSKGETKARLARGEIVVQTHPVKGSEYPRVVGMAVVDAPPEKLWKIIEDCGNYKKTMPSTADSELVSRKDGKVTCRVVIEVPLLPNLSMVGEGTHTVVPGKRWVRKWTMVEGDFIKNSGSWTLAPYKSPDRTLVIYQSHVEPKIAVPASIQRMAVKKKLPEVFVRLRELTGAKKG